MAELNLPNIRKGGDITFRVGLEDGGVSVDWSALEEKRAFLFSDEQRLVSGECTVAVDPEDSTVLVCQYSGDDRQYAGVNSVVVRAKYRGRLKVYDKKAVNIVGRTSAATGVVVIEDPVVPVQLSVEDVSTSLLDGAIDAALAAAAEAEHAAHLIPNQVLLDCEAATAAALNAASKAPYIDETTGRWFVWDAQAGEYVDSGKTAKGDTGNGIASWSVVESQEDDGNNVVTVTFTDGTRETFNVKNGKTGNGIASIVQTVESPDDAGTNVITITMTNGTVVTFNVKNGSKGQPGAAQAAYKSVDTLPTASAATMDKIYLTPSGTTGVYNMSYTDYDGSAYSWVDLGTTAIQLSDYATKAELTQLEAKVTGLTEYSFSSATGEHASTADKHPIDYEANTPIKVTLSAGTGACDGTSVKVKLWSSNNVAVYEVAITLGQEKSFTCTQDAAQISFYLWRVTRAGTFDVRIINGGVENELDEFKTKVGADSIKDFILSESFTVNSATNDSDGLVSSASVTWPDATTGTIVITRDSDGNATQVVATQGSDTYTLSITRNSAGQVTATSIVKS